jgi:hypothetical protein
MNTTGTGMQEDRIKKVVISVKNGKPHVDEGQETIVVNRQNNEEVLWVSTVKFRIDFKGDSPFYEDQFDDQNTYSGLARRSIIASKDRRYKYSIDINGKILDPGIIIDP